MAGDSPFGIWLDNLKDRKVRAIIEQRIYRMRTGNLGDSRRLLGNIYEIRIHYGPGFRVYFGRDGDVLVILLCGGDKSSQKKDIEKAEQYLLDYQQRKQYG